MDDTAFDGEEEVIVKKEKKPKVEQEIDALNQEIDREGLEDTFDGIGKKNTRKKKNKEQNLYGQDELGGVFDQGADSDEVYARKGGKKDVKKEKQTNKNKNKVKEEDEEDKV